MPAMDLCFTPASRLAALIRQRKVSPLEVTQAVLAQIERVNAKVNAYCTVAAKTALADARKATSAVTRRSARLGPLHGVPVSIKDLTPTRGIRTTWGSKIYEHDVPTEDGLVVERLRAAGAIVIGKTNTPEFGAGGNTRNAVFGPAPNPVNLRPAWPRPRVAPPARVGLVRSPGPDGPDRRGRRVDAGRNRGAGCALSDLVRRRHSRLHRGGEAPLGPRAAHRLGWRSRRHAGRRRGARHRPQRDGRLPEGRRAHQR